MSIQDKCSQKLNRVIDALTSQGGDVCFVGGCVRDYLSGKEMKDFDIEVFHLTEAALYACLSSFGTCQMIGSSFGIYKLADLPEADFALPRREKKTGEGHQGFTVYVDPELSIEKAAKRRDFTMNAIYYHVNTRQYIDPYHGIEDLQQGLIRVVDQESFPEDPLRVLRLAQFLSRFDFEVDPDTKMLAAEMVRQGTLETLSHERIVAEYDKMLLGDKPSKGLQFLMDIQALPELLACLKEVFQRPDYHPEGNVWVHTLMVVDEASKVKSKTSWPLGFMWSALLHDVGKAKTTDEFGHAYGHEDVGADMAVAFLRSIQKNKALERYVHCMIKNHMKLMTYARSPAKDKTFLKLLWYLDGKTTLNDLYYLTQSDTLGCGGSHEASLQEMQAFVQDKVTRLGDKAPKPCVNGKDLLDLGFLPGPDIKQLLNEAYLLQLSGLNKTDILKNIKGRKKNGTREHRC